MTSPLACGSLRQFMTSPLACGSLRGTGVAFRYGMLAVALLFAAVDAQAQFATKLPTTEVEIGGERFTLEVARDPATQFRGLGGRTEIDPHGGMLFVFPSPRATAFVMRDCPIAIDVAFLDANGRVLAVHEMTPEEPRRVGESDAAYEARLKPYPSGLPATFAIETAGGRLRQLGVKGGDAIELDAARIER
jgi:uncharacterized membrane protein (UPF0127 family)